MQFARQISKKGSEPRVTTSRKASEIPMHSKAVSEFYISQRMKKLSVLVKVFQILPVALNHGYPGYGIPEL